MTEQLETEVSSDTGSGRKKTLIVAGILALLVVLAVVVCVFGLGLLHVPSGSDGNAGHLMLTVDEKNYNIPAFIDAEGNHNFYYQGDLQTIIPPRDESLYRLAKETKPSPYYQTSESEKKVTIEYYQKFVMDYDQQPIVDDIVLQLRALQTKYGYDSDEYVELATAYVQSLEYRTDGDVPQYPIETLYEYGGDCDDKAILLAAILSHSGYDVVLLLFPNEAHMTLGIKVDEEYAYPNTGGYAIIEVTNFWLVCDPVWNYSSDIWVIPTKGGTKIYSAADSAAYILNTWNLASELLDARNSGVLELSNDEYNAAVTCYNLLAGLDAYPDMDYLYEKMEEYNQQYSHLL